MTVILSRDNTDERGRAFEAEVIPRLAAAGADVLVVPHVYHVPHDAALWEELAQVEGPILALTWLYPRPAEWVLRSHGIGAGALECIDLRGYDTPEQCAADCSANLEAGAAGTIRELTCDVAERWYPVVDYSRCINCEQCLQFCLFDVYALDASGATVAVRPDNCKPGCPACARVCPRGAIMFPLYDKGGAVAGAPGKWMAPDGAARQLFERRTRRPHKAQAADDLDALIDDLDRLTQGRP